MGGITLKTVTYRERPNDPLEWSLDCLTLGQINLLVGKNATGKTRTLTIIAVLARLLRGEIASIKECGYDAVFTGPEGADIRYILEAKGGKVTKEELYLHGERKLERDQTSLKLWYEDAKEWITHEPSDTEVSAIARRDRKQHPFLLPLHDWAEGLRHYNFGSKLGKESYAIGIQAENIPEINDRDENMVVGIFFKAKALYREKFVDAVKANMESLGFRLSEIDAAVPEHMQFAMQGPGGIAQIQFPGKILALGVREAGIDGMFYQDAMSQGMFRALSVLSQVHYSQLSDRGHCILIDDIGEGLDFERSSQLIKALREKAKESKFQLIMATNDQFVMNEVPLDEWSVLQRNGNHVAVRNHINSKKVFEDFRFVGLDNFSFFEMDFVNATGDDKQKQLTDVSANE